MKWLVKSVVQENGQAVEVWQFGESRYELRKDNDADTPTSEEVTSVDNFDYETLYHFNPMKFINESMEYMRLVQNVVKHCEKKRSGLVKVDLSKMNDSMDDCVMDTYVRSREQFSETFKSGGVPCYHDFVYLLSRTAYQLYDAYTYKVGRALREPSLDDIASFTDGHLVNSWSRFMQETSDSYLQFVSNGEEVTNLIAYDLSPKTTERLEAMFTEHEIEILKRYANLHLTNKYEITDTLQADYDRLSTRAFRIVGVSKAELREARNDEAYRNRLAKREAREAKRERVRSEALAKKLERKQNALSK